jgi:hypothetical protein
MAEAERTVYMVLSDSGDGIWRVKRSGASRASRRFVIKQEAVDYAKVLAKKRWPSSVQVHKRDGTFQKVVSYD